MSKQVYSRKRDVTMKNLKEHLKKKADKFDLVREKKITKTFLKNWTNDDNLKNPFNVTKDFIMEKGLKVYGGLALHEHLKKKQKPIYNKFEFPDYDVYSPNAWEHAKELCDRLFDMGFYFVEARSSILNNAKHQTYKVSVDMIYILDLTQSGCTSKQLKESNCKKCGMTKDKKCISIFNNIPCVNILEKSGKEYTKVFDYANDRSLFKNKLFVCSADWLKINMFRELSEPLANPSRLEKVATRLELFSNEYPYNDSKCNLYEVDKSNLSSQESHRELFKDVLKYLEDYLNQNKFIHHGAYAYNFFIKNEKFESIPLNNHEIYTQFISEDQFEPLLNLLEKTFKEFNFKIQKTEVYWKEVDTTEFIIFGKSKSKKNDGYHKLAIFTFNTECLPYVQYNHKRYVTIDRLKYHFFRNVTINKVIENTETYPYKYSCLLKNLISIENQIRNKYPLGNIGKFRRFVLKCEGNILDKRLGNLFKRFGDKVNLTSKTEYIVNKPKGFITKIYPKDDGSTILPYIPAESNLKKQKVYSKQKRKYVYSKASKKKNYNKFNNKNIL